MMKISTTILCLLILNYAEPVELLLNDKAITMCALVDTGASHSSIDWRLVEGRKFAEKTIYINSAMGREIRNVIYLDIRIQDIEIKDVKFSVSDRSHSRHKMVIGRNVIRGRFTVKVE